MEPIPISQLNGDAHFWDLVSQGWAPGVLGAVPIGEGVTIQVGGDLGEKYMIPPEHPSHPGVGAILDLLQYLPSNNSAEEGSEGTEVPVSGLGLLSVPPWLWWIAAALLLTQARRVRRPRRQR